jgi:hypothetical protein
MRKNGYNLTQIRSQRLPLITAIYYNKRAWVDVVIITPFQKTTNDRGNTVYTGIIRVAGNRLDTTIISEHVGSQAEAASLYKDAVAKAQSDGYVYKPFNDTARYNERWQGDRDYSGYFYTYYFYNPDVNSWVFHREYV